MPTHDFLLLPEKDEHYSDYMRYINDPNALTVDDDLVVYVQDTLNWIPTINPANPAVWGGYGLNYYGPTVINKAGAAKMARIFNLWAALLQEGPEEVKLRGGYEWTEEETSSGGRYAIVTAPRDSVVKTFRAIAAIGEQAASGKFYVLHLGV
jgi:hypothetical protein